MATKSETAIKRSDLLNRLIFDYITIEALGRVKQLWLDVKAHQVVSLTCQSGRLGRIQRSFTWSQIDTIGTYIILVKAQEGVESEEPESLKSVVGHEVWTDAGNKAGRLADYCIDLQTGAVTDYLFVSKGRCGVADGIYRLSPSAIISVDRQRLIATDAMVQNAEQYTQGLSQKIQNAAEFLKEDCNQTQ